MKSERRQMWPQADIRTLPTSELSRSELDCGVSAVLSAVEAHKMLFPAAGGAVLACSISVKIFAAMQIMHKFCASL